MTRGILYCAFGARYAREAVASAASSIAHNPIPHRLLTDQEVHRASSHLSVAPLDMGTNPYLAKIRGILQSPFEETLYLDTDTWVGGDLTPVFQLLQRFDVVAAHAPGYVNHPDPDVPSSLYDFNTGVLGFRRTPEVTALLKDWLATYEAWLKSPPFRNAGNPNGVADQPAFRRCVWNSTVQVGVLGPEYNYRTIFPGRLVGDAVILHGRHPHPPSLHAKLNTVTQPRVFAAFAETTRLPLGIYRWLHPARETGLRFHNATTTP